MPSLITPLEEHIFYDIHGPDERLDEGSSETIIFIHGLTANRTFFKHQVSALKGRFRVVAYDLMGHGESDTPKGDLNLVTLAGHLEDLIETLGLKKVTLVGWSLGAHVIFEYIRQCGQDRLDRLCIIDMTPRVMAGGGSNLSKSDPVEPWRFGLRGINGKYGEFGHPDNSLIMAAMARDWKAYAKIVTERLYDKALSSGGVFDYDADFKGKSEIHWMHEQLLQNRPYVIITLWASLVQGDYRSLMPEISVPVLITYGEGSNYYPPETSYYMKERIPDADVVAFPGCGHAPHIQDPDRFNRAFIKFMGA